MNALPSVASFVIRATRSRIEAGLLALPSASLSVFPATRSNIKVRFDTSETPVDRAYIPGSTSAKEARIYGLSEWYRDARIKPGDVIRVVVDQSVPTVYWIIRDDQYRELVIQKLVAQGEAAETDELAERTAETLSQFAGRRSTEIVKQQIMALSVRYNEERRRATRQSVSRLPARNWVRALLGELYEGRCQLCSFGFQTASGSPYFEIHHLTADLGDDPHNLLLVCSNCHAKLTHGSVSDLEFRDGWIVAMNLCGTKVRVKQKLINEHSLIPPAAILFFIAAGLVSRRFYV